MQGVFIQALTYRPPVVLDRQLRQFSSWHGLMLEAADCAYIIGGRITVADFLYGIWVCSLGFADGYEAMGNSREIMRWGQKQSKTDKAEAGVQFGEYIEQSLACPEYWQDNKSTQLRGPYWWHLALFAQQELGMSEAEAWDHPINRLIAYRAVHFENQGWKGLKTDEEAKGIEVLKADAAKEKDDGRKS